MIAFVITCMGGGRCVRGHGRPALSIAGALAVVACIFAQPTASQAEPARLAAADQARINEAIVQGVQYLKSRQFPVGTWGSGPMRQWEIAYAALPGLTLLECGVPPSHSVFRRAATFLRRSAPSLSGTYEIALTVLFLDRLGQDEDRTLIQTLAMRLIAGQQVSGGWSYGCPVHNPQDARLLYRGLLNRQAADALPDHLKNLPVMQDQRIAIPVPSPGTDNSNTHFAILAIWAARRHDVPTKRTLSLIARRFNQSQNENGMWGYAFEKGGGKEESPQMTCVGLLGLAVGQGLAYDALSRSKTDKAAQARKRIQDQHIKKGLEALTPHIGSPAGRFKDIPLANLYFLWALERVGMLYDLKTIGDKDWYRWGAEMLVANQKADGNWEGSSYPGSSPTLDTCLALLFLKRSNLTADLTRKLAAEVEAPKVKKK